MTTQNEDGYTLIESLVALAILASVVVMALSAVSGSLQRLNRAAEVVAASELADQQLQALLSQRSMSQGEQTGDSGNFNWKAEVKELPGLGWQDRKLFRVKISMTHKDGTPIPQASLVTTALARTVQ